MNLKRDAQGIVDAIVAQDIGKFPDLNLAESLQRIPGVVITRDAAKGATSPSAALVRNSRACA